MRTYAASDVRNPISHAKEVETAEYSVDRTVFAPARLPYRLLTPVAGTADLSRRPLWELNMFR